MQGKSVIKLVYCITKKSSLADTEFFHYWRHIHGPIGSRIPGLRRLVQSHRLTVAGDNNQPSLRRHRGTTVRRYAVSFGGKAVGRMENINRGRSQLYRSHQSRLCNHRRARRLRRRSARKILRSKSCALNNFLRRTKKWDHFPGTVPQCQITPLNDF